jgi:uridine kinase
MSARRPFAVGIAGGSGSGKSALIRALVPFLGEGRVARLRYEAYFHDRRDVPAVQRAALEYEAPDAVDTELFLEHLATLRAGRAVAPPRFCFSTNRRRSAELAVEPRPILLIEGVLLLHDPRVRALLDLTIFLDVPDAMRVSRASREDAADEGYARRSGLHVYDAIARGIHARYVEPTKAFADLVVLNAGRLDRVAEIAATVILDRVDRRAREAAA